MPKKSGKDGGEPKKKRSSSKDVRSSSGALVEDGLLPPTPTASHLFAFNPFDDPPHHNALNGSGTAYRGSSRILMTSPLHHVAGTSCYPKGPPVPHPTWKGGLTSQLRPELGHFDSSMSGPAWRPGSADLRTRSTRPSMYHAEASLALHNQFVGQNPTKHPAYHLGDPAEEHPFRYTKINSQNSQRSTTKKADKDVKSDQAPWPAKSKRRSKQQEYPDKSSTLKDEDKEWVSLPAAQDSKSSFATSNGSVPPHSLLPMQPQICEQCNKDIKYPVEDCICCLASCKSWYHRICTGLTEAALNCLKTEELALWACDNCLYAKEIDSVRTRNSAEPHVRSLRVAETSAKA